MHIFHDIWHYHSYILQHLNTMLFHCFCICTHKQALCDPCARATVTANTWFPYILPKFRQAKTILSSTIMHAPKCCMDVIVALRVSWSAETFVDHGTCLKRLITLASGVLSWRLKVLVQFLNNQNAHELVKSAEQSRQKADSCSATIAYNVKWQFS